MPKVPQTNEPAPVANRGRSGMEPLTDAEKREAHQRHETDNHPATAHLRSGYDSNAPGMHPANLPADRLGGEYPRKGTRLDLEDVTGNPGHRGVNPDAPGVSINRGPNNPPSDKEREIAGRNVPVGSINMPPDVEPPPRPEQIGATPAPGAGVAGSINEPPGSTIGSEMPPPEAALGLSGINPESAPIGSGTFALTATGTGFTEDSVIVFDEEDMDTTFVSETELRADAVPVAAEVATVDVEVARGDDLSDVIAFEFTDVAEDESARRTKKPAARKPSKGKRDKSKAKSKKR